MKIRLHNHQNKATGLALALYERGHQFVTDGYDLLLIDHDGPPYYRSQIDAAAAAGTGIALYSHGGLACVAWDGLWEPHPAVGVYLALSEGEADIMQAYGYPHPVEVVGWHWCPLSPFRPAREARVLFAPIHPLANGYMRPEVQEANRRAYAALRALDVDLTVRFIGDLALNGLSHEEPVRYVAGSPDNSFADIDAAEIVVASYTFAHLAAARGRPLVMFGQDLVPWDGHSPETLRFAAHWPEYEHLARYPYDLGDPPGAGVVLETAGRYEAREWAAQHIGPPLNVDKLEAALERAIVGTRSR